MKKLSERARSLRERANATQAAASEAWDGLIEAKAALAEFEVPEGTSLTETEAYKAAQSAKAAYDAAADAHTEADKEYKAVLELMGTEAPAAPKAATVEVVASNPGKRLVQSEVYQELRARIPEAPGSKVQIGNTERIEVADRATAKTLLLPRAAVFSTPDDVVAPDQAAGIRPRYEQPLEVLDFITMASTDSTSVKWVREKEFSNAAAEVAETTQATRTSNVKPESALTLEPVTFEVKTIAHWMPLSKQSLRDVAGLESLVNAKMLWGLRKRLATQVMKGDGEGENLLGITNTPGIGSVAKTGATAEHMISDIYDACTRVVDYYGEQPNVCFVPRDDYKKLRFATLGEGAGGYIFGPPTAATPVEIEGTLILPSADVVNPIVGVWREYAVWMHEGFGLSFTDTHDDFFIRNLVALLAEFSAAAGAMEVAAFCEVAESAS